MAYTFLYDRPHISPCHVNPSRRHERKKGFIIQLNWRNRFVFSLTDKCLTEDRTSFLRDKFTLVLFDERVDWPKDSQSSQTSFLEHRVSFQTLSRQNKVTKNGDFDFDSNHQQETFKGRGGGTPHSFFSFFQDEFSSAPTVFSRCTYTPYTHFVPRSVRLL